MEKVSFSNYFCIAALLVQLGNVLNESLINPNLINTQVTLINLFNLINTQVTERMLADRDFPLVIKICLKDAPFKTEALKKFGFKDKAAYFLGEFNESDKNVQGWAETHSDGFVMTTAKDVLKELSPKVGDVVKDIQMQDPSARPSDPWQHLPLDLVSQERPTFPKFCFTLKIGEADKVKKQGLRSLKIRFTGIQNLQFIVLGATLYCKRNIKEQNVFASGSPIQLDKYESSEYLIQIKENIFVEEDKTKNCQNYPNAKFVSYGNCDEEFLKEQV